MTSKREPRHEEASSDDLQFVEELRSRKGQMVGILLKDAKWNDQWYICSLRKGRHQLIHIGPYPTAASARFSLAILSSAG